MIKESSIKGVLLPPEVCTELIKAAHLTKLSAVYEWVEDQKGNVYFIDLKETPDEFLIDESTLLIGIKQKTLANLDLPVKGSIINNTTTDDFGVYLIKQPSHIYIETVLHRAKGIIFENGGLLSHLALYATQHQIPCIISSRLYNKYILQKEINVSIKQLLK
jgi:phosphohistidine swiveling domain-containing protein